MNRKFVFAIAVCVALSAIHAAADGHAQGKTEDGSDAAAAEPDPVLLSPDKAVAQAPDQFRVRMETTAGPFVIEVTRAWAPQGADRFYNLVKIGFFEDIAFFRVIPNFMVQFGIHGDPRVASAWQNANLQDDPVVQSNQRGSITYAKTGRPHSRSTQLFINFKDNTNLDRMGFAPFGVVVEGMEAVDAIYKVGEGSPRGPGPHQGKLQAKGNAYLKDEYPKLDYIQRAVLVEEGAGEESSSEK